MSGKEIKNGGGGAKAGSDGHDGKGSVGGKEIKNGGGGAKAGSDGHDGKGSVGGKEIKNGGGEAKAGSDGHDGKGSVGGSSCGEGKMAAPGKAGECISREAFESNPQAYFADLHAQEKMSKTTK